MLLNVNPKKITFIAFEPFNLLSKVTPINKVENLWKRFLCYFLTCCGSWKKVTGGKTASVKLETCIISCAGREHFFKYITIDYIILGILFNFNVKIFCDGLLVKPHRVGVCAFVNGYFKTVCLCLVLQKVHKQLLTHINNLLLPVIVINRLPPICCKNVCAIIVHCF